MRGVSLALLLGLFALPAEAQLVFPTQLTVTMTPQYPRPGDTVHISLQSTALDLSESVTTWQVNGQVASEGVGITEYTATAGPLGTVRTVRVTVEDQEGTTASEIVRIAPAEIDLLWEADSYVPPFYKGRALAGTQSRVRLQALPYFTLPGGELVNAADIVYDWYRNGAHLASASGRGRSTATLPGPTLHGTDTITVRGRTSTLVGEASVRITAQDTPLSLYEIHPLFGVLYHRAIEGSVSTLETEQAVTAVPYFANTPDLSDPSLFYEWLVNGERIEPDADQPETLTIRTENYTGPATIDLSITSARDVVMRAARSWELLFNTPTLFESLNANPFGN